MSVPAIGGVGFSPVSPTSGVAPLSSGAAAALGGMDPAAGASFDAALRSAGVAQATFGRLDDVQRLQANADSLAIEAVTGRLADPSQYTIAASEASLATQMTVALRNKAVEAYSEIMRMQL